MSINQGYWSIFNVKLTPPTSLNPNIQLSDVQSFMTQQIIRPIIFDDLFSDPFTESVGSKLVCHDDR